MCFYGFCTFDSSLTAPAITVFYCHHQIFPAHLLPSEVLTAIKKCEWHEKKVKIKQRPSFAAAIKNVAADADPSRGLKP